MKRIKANNTCRHADPSGPHLPQIALVEGVEYEVSDALAESICGCGDADEVEVETETKIVEPESTDLEPESKDSKHKKTKTPKADKL